MKRALVCLVAAIISSTPLVAGCAPSAPASTRAPEPSKTSEVTRSAATPAPSALTSAPVRRVDFPEKGKVITIIVPWGTGGDSDLLARLLASPMERLLGVPVQVVNKPAGGSQQGLTELVQSKPDGYTVAFANTPTTAVTYLDPDRKAVYSRKDFAPVANLARTMTSVGVPPDSQFKDLKELVDAARSEPEKVKVATTGLMTNTHLDLARFQKVVGVKFALVHFDGAGPAKTALMGGHVDASFQSISTWGGADKSGQVRLIGVLGEKRNRFVPDVKTAEEQGFKVYTHSLRIVAAPAGTPPEVIDILSGAFKKALEDAEVKKKMDEFYVEIDYMDPASAAAEWDKSEVEAREGMKLARQQ